MARPSLIPAYATLVLALAALPLIPRIFGPSPAGSGIALKGGQSLSFVYRRDGLTAPGNPADTFHRGDRIQVLFSAARACQVALFSLDSKGALSFYQPDQGGRYCTIAAAAGADQAYPSSIVLDDTHGQELIVALFATQPLETAAVAAWALRHAVGDLRRAESDLRRDPIGADCRVATLLINKG